MTNLVDVYVARRPIFSSSDEVATYELLYGGTRPPEGSGENQKGRGLGADGLTNSLLGIGLERLTDGKQAFVSVTRQTLLDGSVELFSPEKLVLQVPPQAGCDDRLLWACSYYQDQGYRLLVDDYRPGQGREELLELAELARIDVRDKTDREIRRAGTLVERLGMEAIAGGVEDRAMRERCVDWGFDYQQGTFFQEPELVFEQDVPVQQMRVFRLLQRVSDTTVPDREIESVFRETPALSYRLLQLVNSAAIGGRRVRSIRHAIRFLGRDLLHRWLSLLLVSGIAEPEGANRELIRSAVFRGRFLELLAEATGQSTVSRSLFLVGLFSLLDSLTGRPLDECLDRLALHESVEDALLNRSGPYAPFLRLVEAYEEGDWSTVDEMNHDISGGNPLNLSHLYMRAMDWASDRICEVAA